MHSALSKRALALRVAGFVVAVGLGAVGVWLIVTSDTQKSMRLGVLAGLWGLLLGTFVMFGARRSHEAAVPEPEPERTPSTELSRADEAAAQRAYEARLEHMLRREIQTSVAREVGELRGELASLRTELLDKVGGQIALERIETTRIIGSDLEALQREVRQLRERGAAVAAAPHPIDATPPRTDMHNRPVARPVASTPPVSQQLDDTGIVEAEVVEDDPAEDAYHGRRRRDEDEGRTRRGRHSPEGEELLSRLLARGPR